MLAIPLLSLVTQHSPWAWADVQTKIGESAGFQDGGKLVTLLLHLFGTHDLAPRPWTLTNVGCQTAFQSPLVSLGLLQLLVLILVTRCTACRLIQVGGSAGLQEGFPEGGNLGTQSSFGVKRLATVDLLQCDQTHLQFGWSLAWVMCGGRRRWLTPASACFFSSIHG